MILGTAATAGMKPAKKTRVRVDVKQIGSCILDNKTPLKLTKLNVIVASCDLLMLMYPWIFTKGNLADPWIH